MKARTLEGILRIQSAVKKPKLVKPSAFKPYLTTESLLRRDISHEPVGVKLWYSAEG